MGRAVGTDIILQPVHRLRQPNKKNVKMTQEYKYQEPHTRRQTTRNKLSTEVEQQSTFLVLCGFFILEDFFMSTSVVFTQPGCEMSGEKKQEKIMGEFSVLFQL